MTNTKKNTAAGKTVLLVDNDLNVLSQCKTQLEQAGYAVKTAESRREAEEKLAAGKPDLVITELMLEHADAGFTLCHHVKQLDATLPVIVVTAVAAKTGLEFDAATAEERSWIKADAMLAKPVRFEQLQHLMERLTA